MQTLERQVSYAIDRTALCASVMTGDEPADRLTAPSEAGVTGTFDEEFEYEGWPASADVEKAQEYFKMQHLMSFGKDS